MGSPRVLPTPAAMIDHLDCFASAQKRAKLDIAAAVYDHCLSKARQAREVIDLSGHQILRMGRTCVGKTFTVQTLARPMNRGFCSTFRALIHAERRS